MSNEIQEEVQVPVSIEMIKSNDFLFHPIMNLQRHLNSSITLRVTLQYIKKHYYPERREFLSFLLTLIKLL